jgi:hypothetical protein
MPDDRRYDVSGMTDRELERARRDLEVSLALAFPGSPIRVPILAHMSTIDGELAERTTVRPDAALAERQRTASLAEDR